MSGAKRGPCWIPRAEQGDIKVLFRYSMVEELQWYQQGFLGVGDPPQHPCTTLMNG